MAWYAALLTTIAVGIFFYWVCLLAPQVSFSFNSPEDLDDVAVGECLAKDEYKEQTKNMAWCCSAGWSTSFAFHRICGLGKSCRYGGCLGFDLNLSASCMMPQLTCDDKDSHL